nr:hypothetical protein [Tanacetum cinerariifolium]
FENLLDDITIMALFEVNEVAFQNAYYLGDKIYPRWASFVKSFTLARAEKCAVFKRRQKVLERMLKELLALYTNVGDLYNNRRELTLSTSYDKSFALLLYSQHRTIWKKGKLKKSEKCGLGATYFKRSYLMVKSYHYVTCRTSCKLHESMSHRIKENSHLWPNTVVGYTRLVSLFSKPVARVVGEFVNQIGYG